MSTCLLRFFRFYSPCCSSLVFCKRISFSAGFTNLSFLTSSITCIHLSEYCNIFLIVSLQLCFIRLFNNFKSLALLYISCSFLASPTSSIGTSGWSSSLLSPASSSIFVRLLLTYLRCLWSFSTYFYWSYTWVEVVTDCLSCSLSRLSASIEGSSGSVSSIESILGPVCFFWLQLTKLSIASSSST